MVFIVKSFLIDHRGAIHQAIDRTEEDTADGSSLFVLLILMCAHTTC